jgi:hypothetical protein
MAERLPLPRWEGWGGWVNSRIFDETGFTPSLTLPSREGEGIIKANMLLILKALKCYNNPEYPISNKEYPKIKEKALDLHECSDSGKQSRRT